MKSSYVIFICPLVILTSVMAIQIIHTTFESCDPDEWVTINTEWINDMKIITFNIIYKKSDNRTIHRVQITINRCKNHTACTEEPTVDVEDINCDDDQNLSELEMNTCKVANEIANLERQEEFFKQRYGLPSREIQLVFCINEDYINILWNGTDLNNF